MRDALRDAPTKTSRVSLDASTSINYPYDLQENYPTHHSVKQPVIHVGPWVGPHMATWKIRGYVADSEGEDEELDFGAKNPDAGSWQNRRDVSQQGDLTTPNDRTVQSDCKVQLGECATQEDLVPAKDFLQTREISECDPDQALLQKNGHPITGPRPEDNACLDGKPEQEGLCPIRPIHNQQTTEQGAGSISSYSYLEIKDASVRVQFPTDHEEEDSDSPLSTPPDSPVSPPAQLPYGTANLLATEPPLSTIHLAGRIFRPRKAIQINPYRLDFAKHQKDWGERGLKPVHLPRPSSENPKHQEESQESAFNGSSQASLGFAQEPMSLDEPAQTRNACSFDPFDDEPPDPNTVLHEDARKRPPPRQQKTESNKSTIPASERRDIFELSSSDENDHYQKPSRKFPRTVDQDSFPSPPRSTSVHSVEPLMLSSSSSRASPGLPTPAFSSAFRSRKRRIIEDDSQSQSEIEKVPFTTLSDKDETDSSDTEVEPEYVRLMQKQVKGVLPASWLTIDKAQHEMNKKRNAAATAAAQNTHGPGVAQRKRVTTPTRNGLAKSTLNWYEDLVSEEESQADVTGANLALDGIGDALRDSSQPGASADESTEAIETMDDAGIDPMLPARSRVKSVPKRRRRVSKLVKPTNSHKRTRRSQDHAIGYAPQSLERLKRSRLRPASHVLNAPGLSPNVGLKPVWLRIAARQAKKTMTPGTASSEKFIQLDSPEDTAAVLKAVGRRHEDVKRHHGGTQLSSRDQDLVYRVAREKSEVPPARSDVRQYSPLHSTQPGVSEVRSLWVPPILERQSDQYNQHQSLRLTHLRSLLPLRNRSGRGQLVHKYPEPRNAQAEELRQSYREMSRHTLGRAFAPPAQVGHSMERSKRPQVMPEHTDTPGLPKKPASRADPTTHSPTRTVKPKKKRTPVHRLQLRQSLLAPLAPNTEMLRALIGQTGPNVRTTLEQELMAHQAEWFQGRTDGIFCANETTQRHFRTFLQVLESYLSATMHEPAETQDVRGLRSFLYRLVPNRGSIGAQGQVGDKSLDMLEFDVIVARNVFDLHTCLLNLAPAYAPLPRVLETKVNFVDAHHEVCLIALTGWQSISDHHHTQHSIIDGLSNWLYLILTQLLSRWKSAEADARADAQRSSITVDNQIVRQVIEHNRSQSCHLLTTALNGLKVSIETAIGVIEAESLLNATRYLEFLSTITRIPNIDRRVIISTLQVATSYVEQQWLSKDQSRILPMLTGLRQAITTLTSTHTTLTTEVQQSLIHAFFLTVQNAVSQRQKSWDDLFEPTSSLSVDMFVAGRYLDNMKALLYHMFVERNRDAYVLDFRGPVLNHWLRVLLQVDETESCALLTASIFECEKDSLSMSSLSERFCSPGSRVLVSHIRDAILDIRHAAVMHLFAELSGQENNAEADWLPGGLDESDALRLLKTAFTTMKETWMSLSERPEEQDAYTLFIHAALDQYEVHSRSDFTVEPWFFNSATFPQRRKQSLAQLFTRHDISDLEFLQNAKEALQQEINQTRKVGRMEGLSEELKAILLPDITSASKRPGDFTSILARHALFIKQVLPQFIATLDSSNEDIRGTLFDVLVHVASNIECRVDSYNYATLHPLVESLATIITTLATSLSSLSIRDRTAVYTLTAVTFELSISTETELSHSFMQDIGQIYDFAIQDGSREAFMLLERVVSRI